MTINNTFSVTYIDTHTQFHVAGEAAGQSQESSPRRAMLAAAKDDTVACSPAALRKGLSAVPGERGTDVAQRIHADMHI